MYMQLSTGAIVPKNGHYGIENLKRIIEALYKIATVIQRIKQTPPPRTFWQRVWTWIKGLFRNGAALESIVQDLLQIAANADEIRGELLDLQGSELAELIQFVASQGGFAPPREWLVNGVPQLLDAIRVFARVTV